VDYRKIQKAQLRAAPRDLFLSYRYRIAQRKGKMGHGGEVYFVRGMRGLWEIGVVRGLDKETADLDI
jgi:hypothetical protein